MAKPLESGSNFLTPPLLTFHIHTLAMNNHAGAVLGFGQWAMGMCGFQVLSLKLTTPEKPSPQITSACAGKHLFINSCFMTHARAGTLPMQELSRAPKGLPNFSYLS